MRKYRIIALCLSFSLFFTLLAPVAYATSTPVFELGDIYVTGEDAFCSYKGNGYLYCAHINTFTSSGSFAVQYTKDPDVAYEYYFTVDPANMAVGSTDYWNSILSECFSNSANWKPIYLPDSVTISSE